jgi:RHS repeat-associated protein
VTPLYINTDPLNSVNIVSNASGTATQTYDYYPYGSSRVSTGTTPTLRQYLGQFYDASDSLNYLNARFYNSSTSQFESEDPTTRDNPTTLLTDPQQLNFYSYGRDNPMTNSDPDGKSTQTFIAGAVTGILYGAGAALVIASLPVSAPVLGGLAIIGTAAAGYGTYANYSAYQNGQISKDQFDYNSGSLLGGVGVAGFAGSLGSNTSAAGALAEDAPANVIDSNTFNNNVHGNSLSSTKTNYGYQLVDKDSGQIVKFGITGNDNPVNRYSGPAYDRMNAQMQVVTQGAKPDMRSWETQQIKGFESEFGNKPLFNKNYH